MTTAPTSVDFFISYNHADRAWAEWIAWQLEDTGYTTILQAWDFVPGSNFVVEMDRAAKISERTIAVVSPAYLGAAFPQPEWGAAFADDPEGLKRKLIPVQVEVCEPTGLLGQVVRIDLVGLDEDDARVRLLEGISGRPKPAEAPAFPGGGPSTPAPPHFPGPQPSAGGPDYGHDQTWVKLDELIFNVDELKDTGDEIRFSGQLPEHVVLRLEALRASHLGRPRVRFVHGDRVVDGDLAAIERTTRGGRTETTVVLNRVERPQATAMRAGTAGMSPDDLVEVGLRHLLLGEPLPEGLGLLEHMANPGVDWQAVEQAFDRSDEEAGPVARLVLADGLIASGNAAAISRLEIGRRQDDKRDIVLECWSLASTATWSHRSGAWREAGDGPSSAARFRKGPRSDRRLGRPIRRLARAHAPRIPSKSELVRPENRRA